MSKSRSWTIGGLVDCGVLQMGDGYRTKSSELGTPGLPILRVAEVLDGQIAPAVKDHVRSAFRSKMGLKTSKAQDVVVTTKGTVGRVAQIPPDAPEFVYSPQLCFFRVLDTSKVDAGWLYCWFRSSEFKRQADAVASQTDMAAYINLADMRRMRLSLPSLQEQKGIASAVAALDDKVRGNGALAFATQALVRTRLQLASTDAPRVPLEEVAEVRRGLSYKGSQLGPTGLPMVNLGNAAVFGGFKRSGWKHYRGDFKQRYLATAGALFVANTDLTWKLEALGWPMLLPNDVDRALFSHHVSLIDFKPQWAHLRLSTWAYLFTTEARQRIEGMAHGTTVAALPVEALTRMQIPLLDRAETIISDAEALLARGWAAERESAALVALRDALLPALMSGKMRTGEAPRLQGEAV